LDNLMNSNHLGKMNTIETLKHLINEAFTSLKITQTGALFKKFVAHTVDFV